MKIFIYKLLISLVAIFILFQLTVGLLIKEVKKNIQVLSSKETAIQFKDKIREEIKNGLSKEKESNIPSNDKAFSSVRNGVFCSELTEPIPSFVKADCEKVYSGKNNTGLYSFDLVTLLKILFPTFKNAL